VTNHKPDQVQPLERPLLIYDGDCAFCKFWVGYWKSVTENRISYAPYQEVAADFPQIPIEAFRSAAQFIDLRGNLSSGAEAMFRSLAMVPEKRWLLWCYLRVPGVRRASDGAYRFVARHRGALYRVTRALWGQRLEAARFALIRSISLRLIGLIYLLAFASWLPQVRGLIGSQGLLPANTLLGRALEQFGARAYFLFPSFAWLHPTDRFLEILTAAGVAISIPVIFGIASGPCLLLLWALYLSQVSIGGDFMAFQWDILLLEAGFLAVFFAAWESPWNLRKQQSRPPSSALVWLFRWLVFRLFFLSAVVKIQSGDPTWRNLTALSFHYETQPLPNVIAWHLFQLPLWFQKASTLFVLLVEGVVPWFIFAPRRLRIAAAYVLILLQALIFLTGNYCFFNLLTLVLCLFLFDDVFLLGLIPQAIRKRIEAAAEKRVGLSRRPEWRRIAIGCLAFALVGMSLLEMAERFDFNVPRVALMIQTPLQPFYLANTYGLFAVMTATRPEIMIEGSDDGERWREYEFKYKPGDLGKPPLWVAPYQPRLDWQMWFAALSNYRNNAWFENLAIRLLQGSPPVLSLLARSPFPAHPPRYIRARIYDYRFTSMAEKERTGDWWAREPLGIYLPPVSLNQTP